MSMRLKCTEGSLRGELIELSPHQHLVLGREPAEEGSEVCKLPSKTVSRNHCRIEFDGNQFKIIDLRSSNGIRVNRKKVAEAPLKPGDLLQVGEFSFLVEGPEDVVTGESAESSFRTPAVSAADTAKPLKQPRPSISLKGLKLKERIEELRTGFERLDLPKKILAIVLLLGTVAHWIISSSMLQDTRIFLYEESYAVAREVVRSLGDRNKAALKEKSAILLDCNFVRKTRGVVESYILDTQGKLICPVTSSLDEDNVTRTAVMRGEEYDNCFVRMTQLDLPSCDFIAPVRDWNQEKAQFETLGYARIEYKPERAVEALQNLQTVRWKTLFVTLGLLLIVWWVLRIWLRKGAQTLAESVHVALVGNTQHIEKIESFAALDPVVDEVNRLIVKGNQGLKSNSGESGSEASFLQPIFQQVLSLEERPVLVVDKENQVLAATETLANVIPVDLSRMNAHITEAIADTHLQGELVSLLNDLSVGNETIDRALSLSDRVVQVRARPILLNELYVAAVLIF